MNNYLRCFERTFPVLGSIHHGYSIWPAKAQPLLALGAVLNVEKLLAFYIYFFIQMSIIYQAWFGWLPRLTIAYGRGLQRFSAEGHNDDFLRLGGATVQ